MALGHRSIADMSVQELVAEAKELTDGVNERLARIQHILAGDEDEQLREGRGAGN